MDGVHESLTDWRTLPANILAGHRAIVQLDEGTIIDGYLEYVPSKLRKELRGATEGIRESLTVEGVYQPVIISVNAGEKHLANGVKAVNILKEMSALATHSTQTTNRPTCKGI